MSVKPLSVQEKINKLVSLYEKDVSVIYNIYGVINNVLGNWNQSVICFSKAIKIDPAYADAHYNLGIAMDSLGRLEESIFSYTKAIELRPDRPKLYDGLIRILSFYNPKKTNIISIGNTTSDYIKNSGYLPLITSKMQSYEGISESIISYFKKFSL